MDIKTRIRVALGIEEETIALAFEGKLKDGTIIVSEADALAEGVSVMVMTEDGTTIDVPVGSYELEDGTTFVVEEEGIIASMGEAEEVEAGDKDDEDYEEDKEEMSDDRLAEFSEVVMQLFTEMKEEIDVLKEELSLLSGTNLSQEEEIVDLQEKNTELKKQLKETPATDNVNTKKFSKETTKVALSKAEYNRLSAQEKFLYDVNR